MSTVLSQNTSDVPTWRSPTRGCVLTIGLHDAADTSERFEATQLWPDVHLWRPVGATHEGTWVEGAASFAGEVVGSSWRLPTKFREMSQRPSFRELWAREAHGSAACWVVETERTSVHVYPDFLGGCSIFIADLASGLAVSSSLRQLELLLEGIGRPLQRSAEFQAERILLGNGGLWPASFRNVHRLEQAHYLSLEGTRLREVPYEFRAEVFNPTRAVPEVLAAVRADVQSNVRAIATAEIDHRVAHLTGGFDSRLVLAAILEQRLQERFVFFTSGAIGATDRTVADGLAREYGLIRTNEAGLSAAAPRTVRERFLAPMQWSAGILGSGPTGSASNRRARWECSPSRTNRSPSPARCSPPGRAGGRWTSCVANMPRSPG